jgi:phosphoglycerate dehydrogenase-like enzyme
MKALCVLPLGDSQKKELMAAVPEVEFVFKDVKEDPGQVINDIEACIGNALLAHLKKATKLKLLQLNTVGTAAYGQPGALPGGAILCNASGAYGVVVSEFMLAGLLSLSKNLHLYRDRQSRGVWSGIGEMKMICDSTVLILGLGDIGCEFGKRVKAMGANVIGVRLPPVDKPDYVDELHGPEKIDALLPRSDVIALTLPGTPQTRDTITRERFALMKESAFLINTSRGTTINPDALLDAMQTKRIAGAFIDVTDPEPLPADHPLWQQENVILTPHVAGAYSDWFYRMPLITENVVKIAVENLKALLKGQPLKNVMN